jgi:16S rRNA (uracil1498-N3)-methyltransferase
LDFFYAPPDKQQGSTILIDGDEFAHLTHVMRKAAGDEIMIVDGCGNAFRAAITSVQHRVAECEIREHLPELHEPALQITLGVGVLKHHAALDFLVEKVTELGVFRIVPLLTERTIPRHARVERWQKIALAAMKQAGRCRLPVVDAPMAFSDFLADISRDALKCIPHEKILTPLLGEVVIAGGKKDVALVIGPEGGFSEDEIAASVLSGFEVVSLGPRRLRTETAAIAAVYAVTGGRY